MHDLCRHMKIVTQLSKQTLFIPTCHILYALHDYFSDLLYLLYLCIYIYLPGHPIHPLPNMMVNKNYLAPVNPPTLSASALIKSKREERIRIQLAEQDKLESPHLEIGLGLEVS